MFSAIRRDLAKVAPLKILTLRPSSVLTFIEIPEVKSVRLPWIVHKQESLVVVLSVPAGDPRVFALVLGVSTLLLPHFAATLLFKQYAVLA